MQVVSLESVQQFVTLGIPLPFNVRNADHTLLLARGQIIRTAQQMAALLARGTLVDADELKAMSSEPDPKSCPPAMLPGVWDQGFQGAGELLSAAPGNEFEARLDRTAQLVSDLIERDADLAIFWIVRQEKVVGAQYGRAHSMHAGITAMLAAKRLGWDTAAAHKVFKAALTMNMAILDLQDALSKQAAPLTATQRETIRSHPRHSVEMLQAAGVTDVDWLDAVAQHHEMPNGGGYPDGRTDITEMAALLRRADMFTAKLSPRATRRPMGAPDAARSMFVHEERHPMMAAIVKEFGVYPPGCCVRLASGECGLVIKRGPTASTPVVGSAITKSGRPLPEPRMRDTGRAGHEIKELLDEKNSYVSVTREWLATALARDTIDP